MTDATPNIERKLLEFCKHASLDLGYTCSAMLGESNSLVVFVVGKRIPISPIIFATTDYDQFIGMLMSRVRRLKR